MTEWEWLKDAVAWLIKTFGKDVVVLAKDSLQSGWARLFASRNILILGPRQTGKSSLMLFLRSGTPYEIQNGEKLTPDPTLLAAVVDKKFSLQKGNWLKLKTDVPGDEDLRSAWKQAVDDLHPHGIIYMVDGRRSDEALLEAVDDMFRDVFDACYPAGTRELAALHIFVNFSDKWAVRESDARAKRSLLQGRLDARVDEREELAGLNFGVWHTHLSPNRTEWREVTRALHRFGADVMPL